MENRNILENLLLLIDFLRKFFHLNERTVLCSQMKLIFPTVFTSYVKLIEQSTFYDFVQRTTIN